eukprot:4794403-Pyramimonas_sp.AAC.1
MPGKGRWSSGTMARRTAPPPVCCRREATVGRAPSTFGPLGSAAARQGCSAAAPPHTHTTPHDRARAKRCFGHFVA